MNYSIEDIRRMAVPIIEQDAEELERIIVFGSYARGDQTPESDLDIYVDGRFEYRVDDHQDTEQRVSEALSIPVDLITRAALMNSVVRERLNQTIEREGVLVYG
jgi:predicted nucleotidyltransferase